MRDERNELRRKKRLKRFLLKRAKEAGRRASVGAWQTSASRSREIWGRPASVRRVTKKLAVVTVPEQFSFIEDPISAMQTLDELSGAIRDRGVRTVYIDFRKCRTLDLCASAAMTVLVLQAKRSRKSRVGFQGSYPSSERAKILLRSSGLLNYIKNDAPILPSEISAKLFVMELRTGYSGRPERSAKCDQATTKLVEYVDRCLSLSGASLTGYGRSWLATLVGETIANAEEHSRGYWFATAHFDRLEGDSQEGGACHIVLMNFGNTISESFQLPDSDPERLLKLKRLAARHQQKGFFGLRKRAYDEETLCTLYALQEGVSRSKDQRRGIGTTLLIDFFMKLSAPQPKMCILSGRAFISFDGMYPLKAEQLDGGVRRVIAFNNSNSLEEAPDERYVWALPSSFPGTMISLRFNLKKDYVSEFSSGTLCPMQ